MFINRQLVKEHVVHIYNGMLLDHKKERNLTIFYNIDGPGDIKLSEISQTEKDKYHMTLLTCGI